MRRFPGVHPATLRRRDRTNQFKNGTHIEVDGKIFKIVEFQHVKPGKGGAFVRSKLKRVDDGAVIDKTFRAGEKFRPVRTESKKMQYLYESGDSVVLMDNQSYDQVEIPQVGRRGRAEVGAAELRRGPAARRRAAVRHPGAERCRARRDQDRPGPEGRHRVRRRHQAGHARDRRDVQVPLFMNEGDRVRVDTRSGEYVSRA